MEPVITQEATGLLDRLPPELVGPVILGIIVWWVTRAAYRETSKDRDEIIDRLSKRLDQAELSLASVSQIVEAKDDRISGLVEAISELRVQLAESQAAEHSCAERMERLEERYEKRIAELEHEVKQLRGEISEPFMDGSL